jgi:hypothetical protein
MLSGEQSVLARRGDFRSYQQAIDDASAALKQNGKTLDANTQAGRDNQASLDNLASTASAYAQTIKDPVLQLDFLQDSRHQLEQTAESFGMSKQAAWAYTNQVLGIPKEAVTAAMFEKNQAYNDIKTYEHAIDSVPGFKNTVVTAQTEEALRKLAYVQQVANNLHGTLWINVQYSGAPLHSGVQVQPASGGLISGGKLRKFADGGHARLYRGPGGPTGDQIPAMVSDFEFVNKASVVKREGAAAFFALNSGRAHIVPNFRGGGMVGGWQGNGGGQTVVMSDPNIVKRLESIEAKLSGTLSVHTENAAEVGGYARLGAHQVVRANNNLQANVAMAQATR